MSNVSLYLIVLKTHQIEAVKLFYETIGIELIEEQHGNGPVHYAGKVGGTVLEIYPIHEGVADSTVRLGFVVEDLEYVLESLSRLELSPKKTAKQTEWGLRVIVKDPDGRSVELYHGGDKQPRTRQLKLMADYGQTVLWNADGVHVGPVDLDELSLSDALRAAIESWAKQYDNTLNHEYPPESGFASEEAAAAFEAEGKRIWKELRDELGPRYSVVYFSDYDRRLHGEP